MARGGIFAASFSKLRKSLRDLKVLDKKRKKAAKAAVRARRKWSKAETAYQRAKSKIGLALGRKPRGARRKKTGRK